MEGGEQKVPLPTEPQARAKVSELRGQLAEVRALLDAGRYRDGRDRIRPLAYVEESDLEAYAQLRQFPINPCDLCGSQEQLQRKQVKAMLREWERRNPGRLESIFGALEAGALGYLTKDAGAQEIQRAIQIVHAGEALLDPTVQLRVIRALSRDGRAPRREPTLPDDLTPREAEVLRLIAQGLNNREIAERLFVTEATVKTHINNIFGKAGLRDRAQAVVYAIRHGLAAEP